MSVHLKFSNLEKALFIALTLLIPITLIIGYQLTADRPDLGDWITFGILESVFLALAVISIRFRVQIDENEVFHREFVTRRIPLNEITRIHLAEKRKGPFMHIQVQILGTESRIMVGWRKGGWLR